MNLDSIKKALPYLTFVLFVIIWRPITDSFSRQKPTPFVPVTHVVEAPNGYVDVMRPNSPGAKFYEDAKSKWREANVKIDESIISTMVLSKDLNEYYKGKSSPIDHRYYIISFKYYDNSQYVIDGLKSKLIQNIDIELKRIVKEKYPSGFATIGEITQLGIIRNWGSGFINAMIIPFEIQINKQMVKRTKLVLSASVAQPRGVYYISSINVVLGDSEYDSALNDLEQFAKSVQADNQGKQ
jgi:hypothetical protein